ncbi:thiol-disulfide oxidoreductase DCC family protein [Leptobacterium sp. I13]|uniref:thiol-disulfide oxidoreductase DCC family protein n=1 Tax=Leptobacterium meishanense TaxID=3128904 RepID=UPI0030EDD6F6
MISIPKGKKIILFDGVCNLCNGSVRFILKRDKKEVFLFAALQSEVGEQLVKERSIDTSVIDSIILIDPGIAYYARSTAALEIAEEFGGLWSILRVFKWLLPTSLRDWFYDIIAKNRYKWFGKKEHCMIPTPELKARFL